MFRNKNNIHISFPLSWVGRLFWKSKNSGKQLSEL